MDKRARRRDCFARIKALSVEEKASYSREIVEHLGRSAPFVKATTIFAFIALPGEPDLESLFERFPQKRWAFSRVNENDSLTFHYLENRDDLLLGEFGIYEPNPERCPVAPAKDAEAILIPGVSFDTSNGARLGRGKGHYDRYLSQIPSLPPLIGICFGTQLSKIVPESHDVPMDAIVTENGWHNSVPHAD